VTFLIKYGPSLAVGLGGVAVAALWFYVWKPLAFALPLIAVLGGLACDRRARTRLAKDDPVSAAKWINGWFLVPFALALIAAGLVIIVAVALDPGSMPPPQRKEVFSAAAAAIGAFLVAAFVKGAEEADDEWVGDRFKKRFQARYGGTFPTPQGGTAPDAQLAVKSDADLGFSGWGRSARKRRAEIVARALSSN
jgi:hypothetical protein